MRVLHVIPGLAARTGGVASALVELCLGLELCGVGTTIASTDLSATAARSHGRVAEDELPPGAASLDVRLFPARPPRRLAYSPELARALASDSRGYDIVHIHSLWLHSTFAGARAAQRAGRPYVVSPHGMLDPALRHRSRAWKALTTLLWQRRALEHASALHFTAQDEARLAADIAPYVPRAVIANPIDWDSYGRLPAGDMFRERFLGGHDGPLILNHGRVARKKGIDVLLEAFALVLREVPGAWLAVVGPDDEDLLPELTVLADRLGITGRTTFTGMLHGDDRASALAAADVWALPSRQEGWAMAVTEALAAGISAIITPEVNSAPEIERAGAGLVRPRAPAAFCEAIVGLVRDPSARLRLGASARAFARRYDRVAVGAEAVRMYESALARALDTSPATVTVDA